MKRVILLFFITSFICCAGEEKIGIVLSGGGAKGFAHIGVLKVLEEEQVPIEFISGTSMGSIVGALYAMGYSAKEIEEIVLSDNWMEYFSDKIDRKDTPIDDKIYKDRYALLFPVKDWTIKLPKGVIKGKKIESFLSYLYFDAVEIRDFSKLPIAYSCIATDIETGKEVVLDKGNLSECVRASMSIPTVFEPVKIGDKLLVDGMMSKNFPVTQAEKMGAKYIIGCDVGGRLKKKEDVKSFLEIIEQSINYRLVEISDKEREKTNMLIIPDVERYSTMDFNKAKEIIEAGEKSARAKIEEIKKLRDEFKFNEIKSKQVKRLRAVYIEKIVVKGVKKDKERVIKKIISPKIPSVFTREELKKNIDKLYNLGFFEKINYTIKGSELEISVEESPEKELKLGFNYNSNTRGEIFINFAVKGFGNAGSKTSIETVLGKDESLKLQHTQYAGVINKIGFISSIEISNIENYSLFLNEKKVNEYNIYNANLDFMAGSFLSNRRIAGIGIKKEFLYAKSEIESEEILKHDINKKYGTLYFKYEYDSMDRKYFPKSGGYLQGKVIFSAKELGNADFTKYLIEFNKTFKIGEKMILNAGGTGEVVYGEDIPENEIPAIGGIYSRQNSINFYGIEPSRYFSNKIGMGFAEIFYEFSPSRFFIARYNGAARENEENQLKIIHGVGVGIGAFTAVGPIEIIISQGNKDDIGAYINIGYTF